MAVQVNIDDNKIDNFSDGAQTTLKKQMEKYADDIIKEANLIEEAIREDGANTEITSKYDVANVWHYCSCWFYNCSLFICFTDIKYWNTKT